MTGFMKPELFFPPENLTHGEREAVPIIAEQSELIENIKKINLH